jgi:hypothetical protein
MSWGDSYSSELDGRGRKKAPAVADGKALSGIGSRAGPKTEEPLIERRPVVLDMGEASREQGFRLNGCR